MNVNDIAKRFPHFNTVAEAEASAAYQLPNHIIATLGYEFSSYPRFYIVLHEASYKMLRTHPNLRADVFRL